MQRIPFYYDSTSFELSDWHGKMHNDAQPLHRLISTVRQPIRYHFLLRSLFGLALAALYFLLLHGGKTCWDNWVAVAFTYFKPHNSPRESIDTAMYR